MPPPGSTVRSFIAFDSDYALIKTLAPKFAGGMPLVIIVTGKTRAVETFAELDQ
ncbi:hypothetical protein [Streptomyces regalis]|uniref:hypothetical protein n=1 Tax=Streptomyces regalis TaxID=68262 RepID=UPI000AAFD1C4|nr:hypothetical protein [Streptomyces regalis]